MMFQLRGNEIEVKDKQFGNVRRVSWKNNRFRRACVFAWDLCQFGNLSALNRVFCCPCKPRAMGFFS